MIKSLFLLVLLTSNAIASSQIYTICTEEMDRFNKSVPNKSLHVSILVSALSANLLYGLDALTNKRDSDLSTPAGVSLGANYIGGIFTRGFTCSEVVGAKKIRYYEGKGKSEVKGKIIQKLPKDPGATHYALIRAQAILYGLNIGLTTWLAVEAEQTGYKVAIASTLAVPLIVALLNKDRLKYREDGWKKASLSPSFGPYATRSGPGLALQWGF